MATALDIQTWLRDEYASFARGEISKADYATRRSELAKMLAVADPDSPWEFRDLVPTGTKLAGDKTWSMRLHFDSKNASEYAAQMRELGYEVRILPAEKHWAMTCSDGTLQVADENEWD